MMEAFGKSIEIIRGVQEEILVVLYFVAEFCLYWFIMLYCTNGMDPLPPKSIFHVVIILMRTECGIAIHALLIITMYQVLNVSCIRSVV